MKMKAHSLSLLWLSTLAPEAYAQVLGLSIPPALESIGSALQSLVDPTPTRIATVPSPRIVTTRATQTPTQTVALPPPPPPTTSETPPPTTFVTFSTPSSSRTTQRDTHIPLVRTSSKTSSSSPTTKLAEAAASASASSTSNASSDGSKGGPSKGVIAGAVVGVFVALALIGAAVYGCMRNRNISEAWAKFRDRGANKHQRLSDTSFLNNTTSSKSATLTEKEPTLPAVAEFGYGNGTMLGRSPPAAAAALSREGSINSNYGQGGEALRVVNSEVPAADDSNARQGGEADAYCVDHSRGVGLSEPHSYPNQSAPTLSPIEERDSPSLPPQPAIYHQARQIDVRIKRKAVPQVGPPREEALMQGQRLPYRPYPRPPPQVPGQPRMHPAIGGANWPRVPANAYWVEDRS